MFRQRRYLPTVSLYVRNGESIEKILFDTSWKTQAFRMGR